MLTTNRSSPSTACRDPRSHQERDNWLLEETRRTRTSARDHSTARGCEKLVQERIYEITYISPQILIGASSSNKFGCDKNISRLLRHNPLISFSVSCTFLPGREPRTSNRRSMMLSTSIDVVCTWAAFVVGGVDIKKFPRPKFNVANIFVISHC